MPEKSSQPSQPSQPKKGDPIEIPIPKKADFLRDLEKVAPPAPRKPPSQTETDD